LSFALGPVHALWTGQICIGGITMQEGKSAAYTTDPR
jgi:hypothetical protein